LVFDILEFTHVSEGATLESMKVVDGGVEYEVTCSTSKTKEKLKVEKALISIGRVPNVDDLQLHNAGVTIKNGTVVHTDSQVILYKFQRDFMDCLLYKFIRENFQRFH
jgi:pyruvate/2-oxoglutarate dehydrogenase complex dihydrolipoamide dehydrogenase (E3) component